MSALVMAGVLCARPCWAGSVQAAAERALGRRPGAVVVLDIEAGRVIAVVSPRVAAGRAFPVGSVFKLVVARAALNRGVADPGEKIVCRNVFGFGGQRLRCCVSGGHGGLDLVGALAHSCNVHFYHLARRLGAAAILSQARAIGFGQPTGLLEGDEAAGSVPRTVSPDELPLLGIGDVPGLTATVVQMARLAAAIASDRESAAGRVLQRAMILAVAEGTAREAAVEGLTVAGKTGSPTRPTGQGTYAWFVGFAPAERPKIAVAVLVLEGHGGDSAAPVAGKIFSAWLKSAAK